ncbi:MAG: hypothetical protein ABI999_14710 [Acidobacteriota bacterium]
MRAAPLVLALLIASSFGCGPPNSQGNDSGSASASDAVPELTDDMIRERINYTFLQKVPQESGEGEPINWIFTTGEPKDISIVEKQIDGSHATVVMDIKTGSGPRSRQPRYLAGQIRTEWELRTGWVLRQWEIVNTENISMKYRNLPKPPAQDSNR